LKGGSGSIAEPPRLKKPVPAPVSKKLLAGLGVAALVLAFGAVIYTIFFTGDGGSAQQTEPEDTDKSGTGSSKKGTGPTKDTGHNKINNTVTDDIVKIRDSHAAEGAVLVTLGDRKAYDRIEFSAPETVRFSLIAPVGSRDGVKPFYIMETKVWARLYMKGPPQTTREQPDGVGDEAPIFNITPSEATNFAKMYPDGRLPSPAQWDHAAGFHDRRGQAGPTSGGGNPRTGLSLPRPTRLPGDGADKNQFGLIDMGGNGTEWTSGVLTGQSTKLGEIQPTFGPDDLVILRGRRYNLFGPLEYKRIEYERTDTPQTQLAGKPNQFTSFRVVVPIP
jgi:hypothetical protein